MSKSIQEEILSVLWAILALLLWNYEYKILGIIAMIKAIECMICSIVFAFKGAISKWYTIKALAEAEKP